MDKKESKSKIDQLKVFSSSFPSSFFPFSPSCFFSFLAIPFFSSFLLLSVRLILLKASEAVLPSPFVHCSNFVWLQV
jgi:hypothetical protein